MCRSVVFSIFTMFCTHHHCLIPVHFYYPQKNFCCHLCHPFSPWEPRICFLHLWIYVFWMFHENGTFCACFLSLRVVFKVHPCFTMYQGFLPFYDWVVFCCMCIPLCVYPLTCGWTVGSFPPLIIAHSTTLNIHLHVFGYPSSLLWGVYLVVELLGCTVIPYLTFGETAKLFSTVAGPFYVPTSHVPVSSHLHQHLLCSGFFFFFF